MKKQVIFLVLILFSVASLFSNEDSIDDLDKEKEKIQNEIK